MVESLLLLVYASPAVPLGGKRGPQGDRVRLEGAILAPEKLSGELRRLETYGVDVRLDMDQIHLDIVEPLRIARHLVQWAYVAAANVALMVLGIQLGIDWLSSVMMLLAAAVFSAPVLAVLWSLLQGVTPLGGRSVSTLVLTRAALWTDDAVIPWESIEHAEVVSRRGGHDLLLTVDGVELMVAAHAQWTPMSTLRGVIARHAAQARALDDAPRIPAALEAMRQQGQPQGE